MTIGAPLASRIIKTIYKPLEASSKSIDSFDHRGEQRLLINESQCELIFVFVVAAGR